MHRMPAFRVLAARLPGSRIVVSSTHAAAAIPEIISKLVPLLLDWRMLSGMKV